MCSCPGDCEGGPECLDDEGGPLPQPVTIRRRAPAEAARRIREGFAAKGCPAELAEVFIEEMEAADTEALRREVGEPASFNGFDGLLSALPEA